MQDSELKQQITDINTLINTCFIMAIAIDVMNTKAETMAKEIDCEFTKHGKQLFNLLKTKMMELRVTMEHFYKYAYNELNWRQVDFLREDSNTLIRLVLYFSDRTYGDDMKVKQVENFIKYMPDNGLISDKLIKRFKLR